jgi:uncharacterized membrane protein
MVRWLVNTFKAQDRFLNALCGGHADNTISARVGYHITAGGHWHSPFWRGLALMIDSTFKPIDGDGHCEQAYAQEKNYFYSHSGNDVARAILGVIVFLSCLLLWPIIRLFSAHFKSNDRR